MGRRDVVPGVDDSGTSSIDVVVLVDAGGKRHTGGPVRHRVEAYQDTGAGLEAAAATRSKSRRRAVSRSRPQAGLITPTERHTLCSGSPAPGEIVVSQDVQSALVAGGRDPRSFVPAGWTDLGEDFSTAAYLYRRVGAGGLGPEGERWIGPVRRGYLPAYRNSFLGRTGELIQVEQALRTSRG